MEQRAARNWPKVVIGALCVVLLVGVAFRLIQESAVDKELEAFQAKYRALGYPVTIDELKEAHEVPEGEVNAAPLILAALDRIDDSDVDYDYIPIMGVNAELPPPGEPLPTKMASEINYFLSINEEPISELRDLIRETYCNFPINWDDILGTNLDRFSKMRNLARIFAIRALVHGDAGSIDDAIDAVEEMFLLADIENRQPLLVPYLVGSAISGMARDSVQTLVESATLNDAALFRLTEIIESTKTREDPIYPILGDYLLEENYWTNAENNGWGGDPFSRVAYRAYNLTGIAAQDTRAQLRATDALLELYTIPLDSALKQVKTLDAPSFSLSPAGILRNIGSGGSDKLFGAFVRHQISCDAILTALQVEQYRLKEGALPTSLEDLVPKYLDEVPDDPYGDGPLRFRVVGESYVVYSVGSDRFDDGGYDFEDEEGFRPADEIAFVVRRPSGGAP